jgi:hypothetical protein
MYFQLIVRLEFPKTFKIFWWVLLIGFSALYVIIRYDSIMAGNSSYLDIIVFLCFFSLLLMPLFQEIDIFGFRLKREIDLLRHDVKEQILNLRTQIQNTINFQPEISPRFYYGQIPTDEQIQALEQRLSQIVKKTHREHEKKGPERLEFSAPENTKYLFMVKFEIEKEIKRIYAEYFPEKITHILSQYIRWVQI